MTLTFAMGPVHLDAEGEELRQRFGERLGAAMGSRVDVFATRSYAELASMMSRGDAHLGWMPPAVFVRAESGAGLRLLSAIERSLGDGYRGVLFVPTDSPIQELADLRGKRMAWVDRDSSAGYLFVRLALREAGLEPSGLFHDERFEGSHGGVVRAVLRGDADAGATHAQTRPGSDEIVLAGWHPYAGAEGMRAVLVSVPIPPDVICASRALDPDRLDEAREALLHLHESSEDPDLLDEVFGGSRLVTASPLDYEPVRHAVR
ncbi:MAG: PhnD/SsuA/transferrin family substrate-binding protein [Sandaracinaceae bacterium]|nr:PhnD/SsuA/transferrin family substrate-binding protein [Sandaracinaceae bacterium]